MASSAGVEPATLRLETARSGQLSYEDKLVFPAGLEPAACRLGNGRSGQTELRERIRDWLPRQASNLQPHG